MYICLECGHEFIGPVTVTDRHGSPYVLKEKHRVSPCCHGAFAEATECVECGGLIAVGADSHGLCRKCAEKTVARLRYLLFNEFTEAQRETLNDAFDGVNLTEPDKAKVVLL